MIKIFKAWKNWRGGAASNLIDPTLRTGSTSIPDIMRCIHIGLLCVQENVAARPTMASVVLMLNSYSLSLAVPSKPAFFMHSYTDNNEARESNKSTSNSINEASITELYPR